MAGANNYQSDYVKRIAFLDGQVLHDFHLNIMQKNIAESIKLQTTRSKYDFYLLVSPYKMYFMEAFINDVDRDPNSTALLNQLSFSISDGSWETHLMELPESTDEISLVLNYEDYPDQGAYAHFYYRTSKEENWIPFSDDGLAYLTAPSDKIQIKLECITTESIRPVIYDFALLWK